MKIKVTFNFIYTKHYNELVVPFYIFSNINVVLKLNHRFLTHWNHYSWVAFYIHHKLLKHMQDPIFTLEWISNFFHIFLAFNMCIWIEPFNFNMLKLSLTSCILHILKYIETRVIQCFVIIFNWFVNFSHLLIINMYTWVGSCTLNLLKPLFKCCISHLLFYIETHST